MRIAETHKLGTSDGKRWEKPIASRGASAALIPALRAATVSPRRRCCVRPPGQPKVIHSEMWIEWENVRLCSLIFAYVRLIGKKMLRALRGATVGAAHGHH